eukprot:953513-Prorocentrum_minimum.AAC.2
MHPRQHESHRRVHFSQPVRKPVNPSGTLAFSQGTLAFSQGTLAFSQSTLAFSYGTSPLAPLGYARTRLQTGSAALGSPPLDRSTFGIEGGGRVRNILESPSQDFRVPSTECCNDSPLRGKFKVLVPGVESLCGASGRQDSTGRRRIVVKD